MIEAPPGPASDDQQAVQDLRELQEALHEADMERLKSPKTPRKVSTMLKLVFILLFLWTCMNCFNQTLPIS